MPTFLTGSDGNCIPSSASQDGESYIWEISEGLERRCMVHMCNHCAIYTRMIMEAAHGLI